REVDRAGCAEVEKKTVACPYPVCKRIVDEHTPEGNEPAIGFERNSLCKSTGDKGRGDDGELGLEHREDILGYAAFEDTFIDAAQQKVIGVPSEPASEYVAAERHAVAANKPEYRHDTHGRKAVHHRAQHVL